MALCAAVGYFGVMRHGAVAAFGRHSRWVKAMANEPRFKKAFPYQKDVLALPVTDLDAASKWYGEYFGMTEVERLDEPPTVILERDGIRIGFAINGGDPAQDGAAVLVSNIRGMKDEFQTKGTQIGN